MRTSLATPSLSAAAKPLKLIAARLGHSSETLVLATYGHLQAADDREAAEALWEVMRKLDEAGEGTAGWSLWSTAC